MRLCTKYVPALFVVMLVPAVWSATASGDDGPAGVVHLNGWANHPAATQATWTGPTGVVYRAQSPDAVVNGAPTANANGGAAADPPCEICGFPKSVCRARFSGFDGAWGGDPCGDDGCRECRTGCRRCDLHAGNGTYDIVYAVNPMYYDRRDARVYSAAGYGVPMAVPLAPNVEYTYNFGWGVPSSRLTPVSRPAAGLPYGR